MKEQLSKGLPQSFFPNPDTTHGTAGLPRNGQGWLTGTMESLPTVSSMSDENDKYQDPPGQAVWRPDHRWFLDTGLVTRKHL